MATGRGFEINSFARALPHGGARANLFSVSIPTNIIPVVGHTNTAEAIELTAKATTIPPSTIEPVEVPFYGRTFRLPGGRTFDDWETTITNDEDFKVRDSFEKWSNSINGHGTNVSSVLQGTANQGGGGGGIRNGYTTDAIVTQYGKDGDKIREYKMVDAWPHTIGEITLDWAENGTIQEFAVTWAFSWWESVATDQSGNPLSSGNNSRTTHS